MKRKINSVRIGSVIVYRTLGGQLWQSTVANIESEHVFVRKDDNSPTMPVRLEDIEKVVSY